MRRLVLGLAATASLASPCLAADIASGSISVGPSSPTQLGRLSRNSVPQDWAGDEPYPGVVNPTTRYAYTTLAIPFVSNAFQDIYYDITFDDVATDLFASAYLNSYDPTNKALNWLGDAGTSGNYFGTDALYFDVVVPKGNTLLFVVNSATGTGQSSVANYFIQAFSDSEYNENFITSAPVPEPATWGMMVLGFGLAGWAMRRRPKVAVSITRAG